MYRDPRNHAHAAYWMNHCSHCDSLLSDEDTFSSGAFLAGNATEAPNLRLSYIGSPFDGHAARQSCGAYLKALCRAALPKG